MIRKPINKEQMIIFLIQNANDLKEKHGPNNVTINFTDIANYIEQQEQDHNNLREKLKELEWCTGDENQGFNWCPVCSAVEGKSHTDSCWLSKAIKEVD